MSLQKGNLVRINLRLHSGNLQKEYIAVGNLNRQLNKLGVEISDSRIEGDLIQLLGLIAWVTSSRPFTIARIVNEAMTEAGLRVAELVISRIIDGSTGKNAAKGIAVGSLATGPFGLPIAALGALTGGIAGFLYGGNCREEVVFQNPSQLSQYANEKREYREQKDLYHSRRKC